MTLRELSVEIAELLSDTENTDPDANITFETDSGKYYNVHGISVECNGYEIRLYE